MAGIPYYLAAPDAASPPQQPAPFWLAGLALLIVLVVMAEFPKVGAGLLGLLLLVLLVNMKKGNP
jgi:hypothetical protein